MSESKQKEMLALLWVMAIGFSVRMLLLFFVDLAFPYDIDLFRFWAARLYEDGFAAFYAADFFADYLPGYLYVLYIVGAIASALELTTSEFNTFLMIPPILFDMLAGFLLFKLCVKYEEKPFNPYGLPFIITLAYLLNPAVLLNSSVWAQVDGVHTVVLLIAFYLLAKNNKWIVPYLVYGLAVMVKPQALIMAPIFLYAAFRYVNEEKFSQKAILTILGYGVATFAFMALLAVPFGVFETIQQYIETVDQRPFATINAYNFYALTGGLTSNPSHWPPITPFYQFFGTSVIVGISLFTFYFLYKKFSPAAVMLSGAFLYTSTFVFVYRMNERYMFPALLFMLAAFVMQEKRDKRLIWLYAVFTVSFFINCFKVLLQHQPEAILLPNYVIPIVSFVHVVLGVYIIVLAYRYAREGGRM